MAGVLLAVCLAGVLVLTMVPMASALDGLTIRLHDFFREQVPLAPTSMTPQYYGRILNVVMFVPIGVSLAWLLGTRWGWALPLAIAGSLVIELLQHFLRLGRDANLDDVACNAMGAAVGVVSVAALLARRDCRRLRTPRRAVGE